MSQPQRCQRYDRDRHFRRDFAEEVAQIKEIFPKMPIEVREEGCVMQPADPTVLAIPSRKKSAR